MSGTLHSTPAQNTMYIQQYNMPIGTPSEQSHSSQEDLAKPALMLGTPDISTRAPIRLIILKALSIKRTTHFQRSPAAGDELQQLEPHKDERQVGLDTDRSFVIYPADGEVSVKSKDDLKAQLHNVIGYHDIISILLLTFEQAGEDSADALHLATEKLSLHRLRDSMGPGLEPLVGMLRLVKQLLKAIDPAYTTQLTAHSPLPYFALSNILTYFSHDVPTLEIVQHMFDYLLSRPPISIVYLATTLILARKEEVQHLYETGDEGMMHALLCTSPELVDHINTGEPIKEEEVVPTSPSEKWEPTSPPDLSASHTWSIPETSELTMASSMDSSQSWTLADSATESIPSPGTSPTLAPIPDSSLPASAKPPPLDIDSTLDFPPLEPPSPSSDRAEEEERPSKGIHIEESPTTPIKKKPTITLTSLLAQSDELHKLHPPKSLKLSQIMGSQSVVFTWCETPGIQNPARDESNSGRRAGALKSTDAWATNNTDLISDDMAERMVLRPELVVRPWKDEDEEALEREAELARAARKRAEEERMLKKRKTNKAAVGVFGRGRGKVVVVGSVVIVVVVGVAIAIYGKNGLEWRRWLGRSPWLTRLPFVKT
ncbi:SubName: Full=Uncharacterized protein {ECO:0000313/EMBL:CCA72583.1} [Serendipita indica DSM 11827]|nr:SubName: Full=Uncharacterized protein {ECO:0000313/EMBL:CCA72583.1} [Serendipita indica DSM 11827]